MLNNICRKITFRSAIAPFKRDETKPKPKPKPKPKEGFQEPRKGYKSEYKKKFRPFSHYVYEASKGTFTKCRELKAKSKGVKAAGADAPEDPAQEKMLPKDLPDGPHALANKDSDSWYREVLDLRKRAGEYKVPTSRPPLTFIIFTKSSSLLKTHIHLYMYPFIPSSVLSTDVFYIWKNKFTHKRIKMKIFRLLINSIQIAMTSKSSNLDVNIIHINISILKLILYIKLDFWYIFHKMKSGVELLLKIYFLYVSVPWLGYWTSPRTHHRNL